MIENGPQIDILTQEILIANQRVIQTNNITEALSSLHQAHTTGKQLLNDYLYSDKALKSETAPAWVALGDYFNTVTLTTGTPFHGWAVAAYEHALQTLPKNSDKVRYPIQLKRVNAYLQNHQAISPTAYEQTFKDAQQSIESISERQNLMDISCVAAILTLYNAKSAGFFKLFDLQREYPEWHHYLWEHLIIPWWMSRTRIRQYRHLISDQKPRGHEFELPFKYIPLKNILSIR